MADRPVVTVKLNLDQVKTLQESLDRSLAEVTEIVRGEEAYTSSQKAEARQFGAKCADLRKVLS